MSENVKLSWVTSEAEKLIAYCARVSSKNQENPDYAKLLSYCIKNKHWSIFEMATMCVEVTTSRAITAQILRHKSFSFQEFCISGDSLITTVQPNGVAKKIKIEDLYKKQNWKNYKNINIRVYDEKVKEFVVSKYLEVFKTGVKPVFRVIFEDGKEIKATKEHKFLTEKGFSSLEDALGLSINGNIVSMKNPKLLAVNGVPAYHSKDWMSSAKKRSIRNKTGVKGIAEECQVSYNTIRKWLKIHNLQFSKKEVSQYSEIWNKGRTGYSIKPRTREQKDYMRKITPKGKDHHAYKGGSASHRKSIANFFNTHRKDIFEKFKHTCNFCNEKFGVSKGRIELHHIKSVSEYPDLALDINNVVPVHRECHMKYHGKQAKSEGIKKGVGNKLVPRFKKVVKVEYIGEEMTYDMHIDHDSHNYIANGIVVHNSQRYAEATDFIKYKARRQDTKNRQNSIDDMNEEDVEWFYHAQETVINQSKEFYEEALRRGIAKEQARFLLPLNTQSKLYMTGSVRSWIHYLELRCANGTQLEHKEIADEIKAIFIKEFPTVAKALGWGLDEKS